MKKILILIFLICNCALAQEHGRITYKAYFAKSEATEELREKDIMRYQERLDEEMMAKMLTFNLDFNPSESIFYLGNSLISEHENQETKEYVTGLFYGFDNLYINKDEDLLLEQLYYAFGTILKSRKASFVEWNLTSETKTISGYKCFKATYTYIQKWRGREFPWEVIAWYCPEIPVQLGPLRYSGLPGLILELSEDNRGYVVESIDFFEKAKEVKIKKPTKGELLTEEEINRRHEKAKEQLKN
ncbi:GLPGLI family protein [Winogradskyella echinorum]|uniref:GLPGLI family protein n=1 Tax=Winogradskyella echinorum TaxID=538189 RepID=A0ABR6XYA9_9FLAO|nr:GLPGLI family protein [Winogradskyella echinorum]MBC3845473.1 GLPGLI family protein [Winogradskyella echinorum]MBC5749821.1 GLPGLI family protein [Winogradskyella echinorum]